MPNLYQLKIQLKGVTKPPIWRLIEIPDSTSLYLLHNLIQGAMGWTNSHLHEFTYKGKSYCVPTEFDEIPIIDSRKVKINKLLKNVKDEINYMYDLGDMWEHSVVLKKITPNADPNKLPVLINGKGACPPEDCGGPYRYEGLKEILSDPNHPAYDDWVEPEEDPWFDPNAFDLEDHTQKMLAFLDYANVNQGKEFTE